MNKEQFYENTIGAFGSVQRSTFFHVLFTWSGTWLDDKRWLQTIVQSCATWCKQNMEKGTPFGWTERPYAGFRKFLRNLKSLPCWNLVMSRTRHLSWHVAKWMFLMRNHTRRPLVGCGWVLHPPVEGYRRRDRFHSGGQFSCICSRSGMFRYSCCRGTLSFVSLKREGTDTQVAFKVHWGMHNCNDSWVSVPTRRGRAKSDVRTADGRLKYILFLLNNIFSVFGGGGGFETRIIFYNQLFSLDVFNVVLRNLLNENILELCRCCIIVIVSISNAWAILYLGDHTHNVLKRVARLKYICKCEPL